MGKHSEEIPVAANHESIHIIRITRSTPFSMTLTFILVYFPRDPLLGLGGSGKEMRNGRATNRYIRSENKSLLASRLHSFWQQSQVTNRCTGKKKVKDRTYLWLPIFTTSHSLACWSPGCLRYNTTLMLQTRSFARHVIRARRRKVMTSRNEFFHWVRV